MYHIESLLLAKAEAYGIRGKIPTWFAFLGNRVQQVRSQGSVLGPGGQLSTTDEQEGIKKTKQGTDMLKVLVEGGGAGSPGGFTQV